MKRKFIKKFAQEKKSQALWEQAITKTVSAIETIFKRRGENKFYRAAAKKSKHKPISFWGTAAGRLKRYSPWRKKAGSDYVYGKRTR